MTLGRETDVFLSILSESRKMALNEQTGKTLIYNARTGVYCYFSINKYFI